MVAVSSPRVLVIDNVPQILRALRTILGSAGYKVDTAATAELGLVAAAMRPPEAVILELDPAAATGTDVVRERAPGARRR